jgi:hypothetical protein
MPVHPEKPRTRLLAVVVATGSLFALSACDSAEGMVSLPNNDEAGLPDAAGEAATACFSQNVCQQHSDCLAATCDCAGTPVAATERCVNHCCLSVYAACLRACADAGDGAVDAPDAGEASSDAPADTSNDAPADTTSDATDS